MGGEFASVKDCLGGIEGYEKAIEGVPKVHLKRMAQLNEKLWEEEYKKRYPDTSAHWQIDFSLRFAYWKARVRGGGQGGIAEQGASEMKETVPLVYPFVLAERHKVSVPVRTSWPCSGPIQ